jgi:hypothetical protein
MFRSTLIAGAATAALLLLTLGAGPASAATWTVVPAPPTGQGGAVNSISAPTDTDAWAVGDDGSAAFSDHWNGTAWSQVPIPSFPCTGVRCYVHLTKVSASATNAWALGAYSPKPGYQSLFTLYWNGSTWTSSAGSLGATVDVVSSTDAYAPNGPYVGRWNGTAWSDLPTPPNPPGPDEGDLTTISATSATNVWAVGTYDPAYSSESYDNYSVHWNGSAWTEVPMPLPSSSDPLLDYQINSIDAISPTNVWAVGDSGDNVAGFYSSGGGGTPQATLIEHYNGTSWSIVSSPATGSAPALTGVTSSSAGIVWAVGYDTGATGSQSLIENWNGSAWTTVSSPEVGSSDGLSSVSTTPGDAIVWAAGTSSNGTTASANPLVLQNG